MRFALRGATAMAVVCLCACVGGTETGNPSVPIVIPLELRSSEPSAVAIRSGDASAVLKEAWVAIGTPVFLEAGECGNLEDMGKPGPTLVAADLAQPDARIELDVRPQRYCGMWVPMQQHTPRAELPDGAPAELASGSFVLKGARDDGTPFVLAHPEQDEIEVVAEDGTFEVSETGPGLLLAFDVAAWMRGIDLATAELNAEGEIRIDHEANSALHEIFDANHECSLELYLDENENGELDEGTDTRISRCAPN